MAIGFPTGSNVPAGTVSATSVQQPPAIADQKRRLQDQIARQQLAANTVPGAKPVAPMVGAGPKPANSFVQQGGGVAVPALPRFPTRQPVAAQPAPKPIAPAVMPREPATMSAPTPKPAITTAAAPVATAAPMQTTAAPAPAPAMTFEEAWTALASAQGKPAMQAAREDVKDAREAERDANSGGGGKANSASMGNERRAEKLADKAAEDAEKNAARAAQEAERNAELEARRVAKQRKSRTGMGG